MPRTPIAFLPRGRSSLSLKQTAMPLWVAMNIFSSPVVWSTDMSESPSSRTIARRPFERMFFSADCSMRFTVPRFVTKTR